MRDTNGERLGILRSLPAGEDERPRPDGARAASRKLLTPAEGNGR
jgi:hypothetical protein